MACLFLLLPAIGPSPFLSMHLYMLNLASLFAVARQLQEQQLQARQLVLQQQAASAVAAASKTQREVSVWTISSICCSKAVPHY